MTLIARNAYADLFLRDDSGNYQLDVAVGKLAKVVGSEAQFRELAATPEKRNEWFAEVDEQAAAARGLKPNATQCIGFSVPLVFAQGDLHRQISDVPDGAKVRLMIPPKP